MLELPVGESLPSLLSSCMAMKGFPLASDLPALLYGIADGVVLLVLLVLLVLVLVLLLRLDVVVAAVVVASVSSCC